MKVALVTNRFPTLSETFVYSHAAGLEAAGLDVTVLAMSDSHDSELPASAARFTGPVRRSILAGGAASSALRLVSRLTTMTSANATAWRRATELYGMSRRAVRAFVMALPCLGFDVVHFEYSGIAVTWLDALPLLAPARIVVSCRGSAERVTPLVDAERADQLRDVFTRVDRVHCVSNSMLGTCAGYGLAPGRAFVNHPAIDATTFQRAQRARRTAGPIRLLSVGRVHWIKGLETAIQAIAQVVGAGHDVTYELIGTGPDEAALRYAAHDLGIADRVVFSGKRSPSEVRDALERCDIYLLPSLSEGISNAALEAMAMEVPVISSSVGGMPEAIRHEVDGLIVPSRSPAALAAAIERLLLSEQERTRLGASARRRVAAEFTLDRQIATFVREYERLTASAAG